MTFDRRKREQQLELKLGLGMANRLTTARSSVATRRWGLPALATLGALAALTVWTDGAAAKQVRPAPVREATAPRTAEPALCLTEANRALSADNDSMMFMTAFYAVLDLPTGELTYANAGHTPAYIVGPERHESRDPGERRREPARGHPAAYEGRFQQRLGGHPDRQRRSHPGYAQVAVGVDRPRHEQSGGHSHPEAPGARGSCPFAGDLFQM